MFFKETKEKIVRLEKKILKLETTLNNVKRKPVGCVLVRFSYYMYTTLESKYSYSHPTQVTFWEENDPEIKKRGPRFKMIDFYKEDILDEIDDKIKISLSNPMGFKYDPIKIWYDKSEVFYYDKDKKEFQDNLVKKYSGTEEE